MIDKVLLLVAYHKEHNTLKFSKKYFEPIHVGKSGSKVELDIKGDDTGENISNKNSNYNELTALYWAWKNVEADFYGLMHYRRYFCLRNDSRLFRREKFQFKKLFNIKGKFVDYKNKTNFKNIDKEFGQLNDYFQNNVKDNVIFVPKKILFTGMSIKSHYGIYHDSEDWNLITKIVIDKSPEDINLWKDFEAQEWMYGFNMFVMSKGIFNDYMKWLIAILGDIEKTSNMDNKDAFQSRLCGFISERLFTFYVLKLQQKNDKIKIVELDIVKID